MQITLPELINDYLQELMAEMGFNRSELLEAMVFFVSIPDNEEDFKAQYIIGDAGEDEAEDVEKDEEEDETEDVEEDEDEDDKPGFWDRIFGSNDEEEDENE